MNATSFVLQSKEFMARMESSSTFYAKIPDRAYRSGCHPFIAKSLRCPSVLTPAFWIKNFICRPLPAHLPLKHSYALASDRDLQPVYTSANPDAKTALLQTKIVESYGVVALSRVGFDFTHTRAVIYVELLYCGLCGGGQYYYLAKENGGWRVINLARAF